MGKQMVNLSKQMETTRKDTVEIVKLKNIPPEIKSTLDRLNSLMSSAERDSSESTDSLTDVNYPK